MIPRLSRRPRTGLLAALLLSLPLVTVAAPAAPAPRHAELVSDFSGVTASDPEIDLVKLAAFFRARRSIYLACQQNAVKHGGRAEGELRVRLTIGEDGNVTGAEVVQDGLGSDAVACILNTMAHHRVPFHPSSPATVEVPMSFALVAGAPPVAPSPRLPEGGGGVLIVPRP